MLTADSAATNTARLRDTGTPAVRITTITTRPVRASESPLRRRPPGQHLTATTTVLSAVCSPCRPLHRPRRKSASWLRSLRSRSPPGTRLSSKRFAASLPPADHPSVLRRPDSRCVAVSRRTRGGNTAGRNPASLHSLNPRFAALQPPRRSSRPFVFSGWRTRRFFHSLIHSDGDIPWPHDEVSR